MSNNDLEKASLTHAIIPGNPSVFTPDVASIADLVPTPTARPTPKPVKALFGALIGLAVFFIVLLISYLYVMEIRPEYTDKEGTKKANFSEWLKSYFLKDDLYHKDGGKIQKLPIWIKWGALAVFLVAGASIYN